MSGIFKIIFALIVAMFAWSQSSIAQSTPTPTPIFTDQIGLVGYWNFDEGSGDVAYDSSGYGNHGILHGATWSEGKYNKGIRFDGNDDYISIGSDPSIANLSSSYSIVFWVNIESLSGDETKGIFRRSFVSADVAQSQFDIYFYRDGRFCAMHNREISGETSYWNIWPAVSIKSWLHVAVVWNSKKWNVYINGQWVESSGFTGTPADPQIGAPSYIGIGYRKYPLNGCLDEFRIYNRALSESEIKALYNNVSLTTPTVIPTLTPTPTPTPQNWSSLNGKSLEENKLAVDPPSGYTLGKIQFGEIPAGSESDGQGMEIKLAPGQGVWALSSQEFEMSSLTQITGSFRASNQNVAVALVALNSPIDGQIGYTNLMSGEIPVNDYRRFRLVYNPPSGKMQIAVQAVNSPFSSLTSTVWVDNLKVEPFIPSIVGTPVSLDVAGNFEGGLENLLVNINDADGNVIPFFESITDIAVRMMIEPENTAANIGTALTGVSNQFPLHLLGQVSVKRDSLPGGGLVGFVITNGFQNLGLFRFADGIPDQSAPKEENLILGGDFTLDNPNIPVSAFVQIGGPNALTSVVVDDLVILRQ